MFVLSILNKLDKEIIVSNKFGIVLTNLPKEWQEGFIKKFGDTPNKRIKNTETFKAVAECIVIMKLNPVLSSKMNLINKLVPQGTCEDDYCEKFYTLFEYITNENCITNTKLFSLLGYDDLSTAEKFVCLAKIFDGESPRTNINAIEEIKKIGKLIDDFIETDNDFMQVDFLIKALSNTKDYSLYHILRVVTILECIFCKNEKDKLSDKLFLLFSDKTKMQEHNIKEDELKNTFSLFQQIRNKIAHGDFKAVFKKLEEYKKMHMKNFNLDLIEKTEQNWIILNICCMLEDILKIVIRKLFTYKKQIINIRNSKSCFAKKVLN